MLGAALTDQLAAMYGRLQLVPFAFAIVAAILVTPSVISLTKPAQ
jgi:hypothetical protein